MKIAYTLYRCQNCGATLFGRPLPDGTFMDKLMTSEQQAWELLHGNGIWPAFDKPIHKCLTMDNVLSACDPLCTFYYFDPDKQPANPPVFGRPVTPPRYKLMVDNDGWSPGLPVYEIWREVPDDNLDDTPGKVAPAVAARSFVEACIRAYGDNPDFDPQQPAIGTCRLFPTYAEALASTIDKRRRIRGDGGGA